MIGIHAGAGYHSKEKEKDYRSVCQIACLKAMEDIRSGLNAAQIVMTAVTYLENSSCTNAGVGSNLTIDGRVECDASVMDGDSLLFGAVGCVSELKNPVQGAYKLLEVQKEGTLSLGRLPPSILVGEGANEWMRKQGLTLVDQKSLITESSMKSYKSYKRKLHEHEERKKAKRQRQQDTVTTGDCSNTGDVCTEQDELIDVAVNHDNITDTVGAVAMDSHGNVAAAVSSGGISLKHSGRLGPAATYGAGCWAYNWKSDDKPGIAVATSGSGEHIMRTLLAKECASCLHQCDNASLGLSKAFNDHFLESEYLRDISDKLAGVLALRQEFDDGIANVELVWGHTTDSMCIGYMSNTDKKPKVNISRLPMGSIAGRSFTMEGRHIPIKITNTTCGDGNT